METVKVDIQKLQLLNDRINQTIDALTQLRQTVHAYTPPTAGLQHTGVGMPFGQQGFVPGYGVGFQGGFQAGFPQQQTGLQHTMAPWQNVPGAMVGQNIPGQIQGQGYPGMQQGYQGYQGAQSFVPPTAQGWWNPMGGLSHSSQLPRFEAARLDPNVAMWITQQFPYAFSPTLPVI